MQQIKYKQTYLHKNTVITLTHSFITLYLHTQKRALSITSIDLNL